MATEATSARPANRDDSPRARAWARAWPALAVIGALAGAKRLWFFASTDAMDFEVYWRAAHRWVEGSFPYLVIAQDRGFVFKYPPWVLPLFLPFAWLDFSVSKAIWYVIELLLLLYSVSWVARHGVTRGAAVATAFLYWWLWLAHFSAGQFTLVLLAASLWAVSDGDPAPGAPASRRTAMLAFLLSAKVFSVVSLAGIAGRFRRPGTWLWLAGLFVAANAVTALFYPDLAGLYRGWRATAVSGGAELGAEIVRGAANHGFTAGILNWAGVDARAAGWDLVVATSLAAGLGFAWSRLSRGLSFGERWSGWLALGVIAHPLAWHHSFVMVYPLCAYALDRGWRARSITKRRLPPELLLALLGITLIALVLPPILGTTLIKPFELMKNKSWGTLLCAWGLVLAGARAAGAAGAERGAPSARSGS